MPCQGTNPLAAIGNMEGTVTRYEWLDRDHIILKEGYARQNRPNQPRLAECTGITLRYDPPEGRSRYGTYTASIGGAEFEFATVNLDISTQEESDAEIAEFFRSRPRE